MRRRLLSALLALCMALTLLPAAFAAGSGSSGYSDSGSAEMPKLTKLEIAQLMKLTELSNPTDIYSTAPNLSAPYSAGSLRQDILQAGLDRLNALRRIAGLPAVALDTSYNASTQAASLVSAVNNELTHYPPQPSGMDDALYQQGYAGAGSSNIAYYRGYRPADGPVAFSVDMWMDDSDVYNVDRLGHRRWQLNPTMTKTGFGAVFTSDGGLYSAEYAHERSGPGVDYDFIAWPASGNFPVVDRLFHTGTAWSVSLNPSKYQTPSASGLTVTLTRESDGKSWTFRGNESYTAANSGKYFNLNTGGYGVNNCIIFRPDGVGQYSGVYTVTITGLQSKNGAAATLSYQVDFFNPDDPASFEPTPTEPQPTEPEPTEPEPTEPQPTEPDPAEPEPTDPQPTEPEPTDPQPTEPEPTEPEPEPEPTEPAFVDVPASAWYAEAVQSAAARGFILGDGEGHFNPGVNLTRGAFFTVLARVDGANVDGSTPWYQKGLEWAVAKDVSYGNDPDGDITREQLAAMLWRYAGRPGADVSVLDGHPDSADVHDWDGFREAMAWAVSNRLIQGDDGGKLNPLSTADRAQAATILMRCCQLLGI